MYESARIGVDTEEESSGSIGANGPIQLSCDFSNNHGC